MSIDRWMDKEVVVRIHNGILSEWVSHSVVSNSLRPCGLYSPWNSRGQNPGVGSLSLLQGIVPTQGSNPWRPHCGRIRYQLSYQGSLPQWLFPISIPSISVGSLLFFSSPTFIFCRVSRWPFWPMWSFTLLQSCCISLICCNVDNFSWEVF